MKTKKLTINLEIKEEVLTDLLISAVEGGSNYWLTVTGSSVDVGPGQGIAVHGVAIRYWDSQDNPVQAQITPATMLLGLQRLAERMNVEKTQEEWHLQPSGAARILAAAITGSGDASTADVVLQMGVLGETVFG